MKKRNFNGRSSFDGDQTGNWRSRLASLVNEKCIVKVRDPSRLTSNRTKVELNQNAQRVFGWLRKDLGFCGLSNPYHLSEKHFIALADHITAIKNSGQIGGGMAAGYGTICRHLARWIDKPELVKVFGDALGKDVTKRTPIAERDKSWEAAGVNLEEKIIEIMKHERWVGLALWCQHTFGMRKNEVLMFQPLNDIRPAQTCPVRMVPNKRGTLVKQKMQDLHWRDWTDGVNINIIRGTKGKRPRVLFIEPGNDKAKTVAWSVCRELKTWDNRDTLGPAFFTLQQNARTYERVLKEFGITKNALGTTGHGLRAGFACDMLESFDITPTVRGGDGQHPDPDIQRLAYKETTEAMGHGRISVISAYAGGITPQAAARQKKARERQALIEAKAQGPSAAEEMTGLVTQWNEQHKQLVTQSSASFVTQKNQCPFIPASPVVNFVI